MNLPASWRSLLDHLRSTAGVSTVFGAPVTAHGRTLIPVARVAFGFGGGHGPLRGNDETEGSTGQGMGGGVVAKPVGVVEIGPDGARFVVFRDGKKVAAAAVGGFVLGLLVGHRLAGRS